MLAETVAGIAPKPGGRYVDATLGRGGHSYEILKRSSPDGHLVGWDRDTAALEAARTTLAEFGDRFELRHGNFADLCQACESGSIDGAVLDLGVSSYQLDTPDRGFSFMSDGPLDMRMDRSCGETAADFVNTASESEMTRVFREYGEERRARAIAGAIVKHRQVARFATTSELAGLVERVSPRRGAKIHPATRVFQALRIHVNDELGSLERGLDGLFRMLRTGGRLAVITFHSLEAGIVKRWGRDLGRDYVFEGDVDVPELRVPREPVLRILTRKALLPTEREIEENPRSRSAQLRIFERI